MWLGIHAMVIAEERMTLSLPQAEKIFLEQNLDLIAREFDISIADAEILQAKLWPNPELRLEFAAYDLEDKKFFQTGDRAQRMVELMQTVKLGGKIKKNVAVKEVEKEIAQVEFYDFMRELKNILRVTFAQSYFQSQMVGIYEEGISPLSNLIQSYKDEYNKGNISKAELTRLRFLLTSLQKEQLDLKNELVEQNSELKLLLNLNPNVDLELVFDEERYGLNLLETINQEDYVAQAFENRFDYKATELEKKLAGAIIKAEKAEAIPDLEIGMLYDRRGSFQADYFGLQMNIDLPIFDRNQGNIAAAKMLYEQKQVELEASGKRIESETLQAYQILKNNEQLYFELDKELGEDASLVMQGIVDNFKLNHLSLLEFIDFFESYKDNYDQFLQVKYGLFDSMQQVNYATGKDFFTF
ncbi:cation transporter [Aureibacter tunicatorum]|nr:cation transporter [Aureibacter tunicatorum]